MRALWSGMVVLGAVVLVVESWVRGYAPGDPDGIATRQHNVMLTGALAGGLALLALIPARLVQLAALVLATLMLAVCLGYRLEIIPSH